MWICDLDIQSKMNSIVPFTLRMQIAVSALTLFLAELQILMGCLWKRKAAYVGSIHIHFYFACILYFIINVKTLGIIWDLYFFWMHMQLASSKSVKFSFSKKETKVCAIFLMVWTFTISKCRNHKKDCAIFFGLLRKAELYHHTVSSMAKFDKVCKTIFE